MIFVSAADSWIFPIGIAIFVFLIILLAVLFMKFADGFYIFLIDIAAFVDNWATKRLNENWMKKQAKPGKSEVLRGLQPKVAQK